jgi:hypothetical protein
MRSYSVHAPPGEPAAPEKFAFVKEGFSWPALFVPILWILWHRLWLTLVGYIVYVLVLAWIGRLAGDAYATLIGLLGNILFALEANNIRRLSLENRGWREVGIGLGRDLTEAEMRFFQNFARPARTERPSAQTVIARAAYPVRRAEDGDPPVLGLFPEPER